MLHDAFSFKEGSNITFARAAGQLTIGVTASIFQPLDATLTALAAFNTNGLLTQTAADTFAGRTITGTAQRITVTNGNGVAGNPTLTIASDYPGQTSIITLGTVTTGIWSGTPISVINGGTGLNSISEGAILYSDTANSITTLAFVGTATRYLSNTGASSSPAWAQIDLSLIAGGVTGALPIINGGTGQTNADSAFLALAPVAIGGAADTGALIKFNNATGLWVKQARGTNGQFLQSTATDITWASISSHSHHAMDVLGSKPHTHLATDILTGIAGRTITGTTNRITVTNGDGSTGNPTIDISTSYAGQNTITTLGTITIGVWNGTPVTIGNGGTGQTAKDEAFDALAPTTTLGDMIYFGATDNVRLPIGVDIQYLTVLSGSPVWGDLNASHIATGTVPNARLDATLAALAALTITDGSLIYGTGTDAFAVLAEDTNATRYLSNTGTSNHPAWAQVDLTNGVTGTLPAANGGYDVLVARAFARPTPVVPRLKAGANITITQRADEFEIIGSAGGAPHTLLDGSTHSDTIAQTPGLNSLVVGNAVSLWTEVVGPSSWGFLMGDNTTAAQVAFSASVPDDQPIYFGSSSVAAVYGDAGGDLHLGFTATGFTRMLCNAVEFFSFGTDTATGTKPAMILRDAAGAEYGHIALTSTADMEFRVVGAANTFTLKHASGVEVTFAPNAMTFNNGATDTGLGWGTSGRLAFVIGASTEMTLLDDELRFANGGVASGFTWSVASQLNFYIGSSDEVYLLQNVMTFEHGTSAATNFSFNWDTASVLKVFLGTIADATHEVFRFGADKTTWKPGLTNSFSITGTDGTAVLAFDTVGTVATLSKDKYVTLANATTSTVIDFATQHLISFHTSTNSDANEAFRFDCNLRKLTFDPNNTDGFQIDGNSDGDGIFAFETVGTMLTINKNKYITFNNDTTVTVLDFKTAGLVSLHVTSNTDANEAFRFDCINSILTFEPNLGQSLVIDAGTTNEGKFKMESTEILRLTTGDATFFEECIFSAAKGAIFNSGSAAGSVEGAVWNDSTRKALTQFTNGVLQYPTNTLYVACADVLVNHNGQVGETYVSLVNLTTPGTTYIGTNTLPAGFLTVGKTIRVTGRGYLSLTNNAGNTFRFAMYVGGTALKTNSISPVSALSSTYFEFNYLITCRTTGNPGTLYGQGHVCILTGSTTYTLLELGNTSTDGVNTTGTLALEPRVAFDLGSELEDVVAEPAAAASVTMTNLVIEAIC
jgi:hypothetical protein